jgi:hypothetical protein
MIQATQILNSTNPKMIVKGENSIKGIYGVRQIQVTYDKGNDLFNLYAFNLNATKSVYPTKEIKIEGVFIEDLKKEIEGLK